MAEDVKTFRHLEKKNKNFYKKLKLHIKHRLGWLGVPQVIAYRGFGNDNFMFIKGYVTEDKGLAKPDARNNSWKNILSMIKRYASDEIPAAEISLNIEGKKEDVVTDEYGLFEANLVHATDVPFQGSTWIKYQASLRSDIAEKKVSAEGEILIPGRNATFGVISDIDDTILISYATQTLRKLRLMLLRNSRTRKPFPGVDAFYQALYKGYGGNDTNPFFYVSSSEWNLYDLLEDFCSYNKLPKGVFLLRELKTSIFKFWKSGQGNHNHKLEKIRLLFNTYPDLSFVLIGDNGQRDPEIYASIAREFPERIKAIYIRAVKNSRKNRTTREIMNELQGYGIRMILARDTVQATHDAVKRKLIAPGSVQTIIRDAEEDLKTL